MEGETGTLALDRDYRLTLETADGVDAIDAEPPLPAWGERPWHAVQDSVRALEAHAVDVLQGRADLQPSGVHNLEDAGRHPQPRIRSARSGQGGSTSPRCCGRAEMQCACAGPLRGGLPDRDRTTRSRGGGGDGGG